MNPIFYPMFAQVLLTFIVWAFLTYARVGTLIKNKIHPQEVAVEARALEVYKSSINLSDNFENLFEVPVLFFVAILAAAHLGVSDQASLAFAWGFVILRAAHSLIHSTSNYIRHRFAAHFTASLCLWALWIRIVCHS